MTDGEAGREGSFYESLIEFRVAETTIDNLFPTDWRQTIARNRAFYIRGLGWFRSNVEETISNIRDPDRRLSRIVAAEPRWQSKNYNFANPYALNQQLYPAFNSEPLQFEKAVQTILLLYSHAIDKATDLKMSKDEILERFSIEPAVSYISSFTEDLCRKIESKRPHYLHHLAECTLQNSKEPIFRLARAEGTVTHKFACRIRDAIARISATTLTSMSA